MSEQREHSFEVSFRRLEEIVRTLEAGQPTLEESLALFEEGIALANQCLSQLNAAEGKVEQLLKSEAGQILTEPLKFD